MPKPFANKRRLLMLRWMAPTVLASALLVTVVVATAARKDPAAARPDGTIQGLTSVLTRSVPREMVTLAFEDVTASTGISLQHFPARRQSLLPEDMGSGLAWGDYDDDGRPDLFIVNFAGGILDPLPSDKGRCALYHNEGDGRFSDATDSAGLGLIALGMGAAWGDYDADGDLDLYVTCYGPNHLYRNDAGRFTDVTDAAGVAAGGFSSGCAWADYDNDGLLDLYVCRYVDFQYRMGDRTRIERQYGSEVPYTLNPSSYKPVPNLLYRNNGDGTFTDVAPAAGVANADGRSLSAIWMDFDNDSRLDLYVANDVSCNGVYRNRGDGTFEDIGASSLAADYRGAMGLAAGDVDRDGDCDLYVTHWIAQENAYFQNMLRGDWTDEQGRPRVAFMDNADDVGLGQISLDTVGWAAGFVDFDNDGLLDLWVCNGSTLENASENSRLVPERMHLFRQFGEKGFYEMAQQACAALAEPMVARGGAEADFDGDGRVDLAVLVHGGPVKVLRNTSPNPGHWLNLRLRQTGGNTRAIGARISVRTGQGMQVAQLVGGGSYLSQNSADQHFGLGQAGTVDELTITWPDGATESHQNVPADRTVEYRRAFTAAVARQ
jgi:hypothetical protein